MRPPTLLLPILAAIAGCSSAAPAPSAPPPPTVTVAAVVERVETEWADLTGRVQARSRVEIRPRVGGVIDHVAFADGALVEPGALLFEIDRRPYVAVRDRAAAVLAEAEARLAQAERDRARAVHLRLQDAVAAEVLDQRIAAVETAGSQVAAARAALAAADLDLAFTRITAPIAGRISAPALTAGNLVTPGAGPLAVLATVDPVRVAVDLDERTWTRARAFLEGSGRRRDVLVGLDGEDGHPHHGRIDYTDTAISAGTGTIRIRVVLPNPGGGILPGAFARVRLPLSEPAPRLLVDGRAIGTDQGRRFVLVVGADGVAEHRPVRLGPVVDGLRIVDEGLAPGEQVIVEGLQRARPGRSVTARRSEEEASPAVARAEVAP